jgi:ketosteroid isomerase-like protein
MASKAFDKRSSYYADDAVLMIPGDPPVGKDAIPGVSKVMRDEDMDLKLASTKVDVAKSGDIGYVQGVYTIAFTEPKSNRRMLEKGNYVNIYKKRADGAWKIVEDIHSRDSLPTPVLRTKVAGKRSTKSKAKK